MSFSRNLVKFSLILMILIVLSISVVSASDDNSTDEFSVPIVADGDDNSTDVLEINNDNASADELEQGDTPEKETPLITVDSSKITTGNEIQIYLKDSKNTSLVNKDLTAIINKKEHALFTNEKGIAKLKLDLPANKYVLQVKFKGDDDYAPITKSFDVTVQKLDTKLAFGQTSLKYGDKLYVYLKDSNGKAIESASIEFTVNGNKYDVYDTNEKGRTGLRIKLSPGKYNVNVKFAGDSYHNSVSAKATLTVLRTISINIGNSILLTNGFLRIYLKGSSKADVAKKTIKVTIKNKVYTKKTNSEGFVVFKPKQGKGKLTVKVRFGGTSSIASAEVSKQVTGIKGNAKNPLAYKIPLKKGVPNVDYMWGRYVMGNGDMTYTVLKAHYKDVLKRDSYCLFLNKKLSKYTFFKSKAEPTFNHIIKREKWNVIERAINTLIVKKNKNGYWPYQVTVSLKGKSYTYPEVRDVQNTGYTCGPTSSSMCSQALRNYYCESYLAQKSGSDAYSGSSTSGLKYGLEKCHFKCSYFYQSSFNKALKELKKGGCALVFHTWNHYVCILDISKDGKKVLVGNPSGDYDEGSHSIPTNWLTVKHMKGRFNDYDTSGLIVKLNYKLSKATKKQVNSFYSSMGSKWSRQNTNERLVQIQDPFY